MNIKCNTTLQNLNARKTLTNIMVWFTVLFCIMVIAIFCSNLITRETLLWSHDGLSQQYPIYVKVKKVLLDIIQGNGIDFWSWDIGLGTDMLGSIGGTLLSPAVWLVVLVPFKYIDLAYTAIVILRMYLGGLAFILFAHKMDLNRLQCLAGSVSYVFSSWVLYVANIQGQFLKELVLFPLLILGAEKVIRKENPLLFIGVVFIHLCQGIYYSYMVAFMIIIYYVVRWLMVTEHKRINEFLKELGVFFGYGIVGILTSAVFLLIHIYSIFNISTSSGNSADPSILYPLETYLNWGYYLVTRETYESYSIIAFSGICLAVIPIFVGKLKEKITSAFMATICLFMALFPIFSSFFNGGGYVTGRWFFMLFFFVIWAAVECIDIELLKEKKNQLKMLVWLCIVSVAFVIPVIIGQTEYSIEYVKYGVITIIAAFSSVLFVRMKNKKRAQTMIIIVLVLNLALCGIISPKSEHLRLGKVYSLYESSIQTATRSIEDDDFYRVDQVEGISKSRVMRVTANENMYLGSKSVYTVLSKTDEDWYEFNKSLGNNAGYVRRSYIFSNDNRSALDFLMGVKYFLGSSDYREPGASEYAPYGFEVKEKIDGVELLENRYHIGLGCLYKKCISRSDFETLNYFEKEQAIMQAMVVPDSRYAKIDEKFKVKSDELVFNVDTVKYSVDATEGIKLDGNNITVTNGATGKILIKPDVIKDRQIVVAFENLNKIPDDSLEEQAERDAAMKFTLNCDNGIVTKRTLNSYGEPQGFNDIVDYNINMGYSEVFDGQLEIYFDESGNYKFDSLKIYALPMDSFEKNAQILQDDKFQLTTFENDYIEGVFESETDSLAYFSILDYVGWQIYIDGEKADKIGHANIAFTGVEIPKGKHTVTLKYSNIGFKYGWPLTLAGILILIVTQLRYRKSRNEY